MGLADRAYMYEKKGPSRRRAGSPSSSLSRAKTGAFVTAIVSLLILNGYMAFSVMSMAPVARQHFVDVLLSPSFGNFLAK